MSSDKKGIWIPLWMLQHQQLTLQEKVLLAEIRTLDNSTGCFASNAYLADFLGVSQERVRKIISSLKCKGWVDVQITQKGQNNARRTITLNRGMVKNNQGVWSDSTRGYGQIQPGGMGRNNQYINKDISKVEKEEAPAFDFLKNKDAITMETWEMKHHKQIEEYTRFKMDFNDTVTQEQLPYKWQVLYARLNKYARAWISNQNRWGKSDPQKDEPIPPYLKMIS